MSSDHIIFEESATIDQPTVPFVDKDYAYVIDQNNGSYQSSQVIFDTSTLSGASSDRMISWRDAYIEIPVVMSLNGSGTGLGTTNIPFGCGLKNGYYQLIHSWSVEINGKSVTQLTPFSNLYMNFKCLTSWSKDDLNKWGATCGVAKDNPLSFGFSAYGTASAAGDGVYNNLNYGYDATSLNAVAPTETSNLGFLQRQREYCIDPTQAPWSNFISQSNAGTIGKSFHGGPTAGTYAGTNFRTWFMIAKIRLIDLSSDFFEKIPLVKGMSMRLTLNLNTGSQVITRAAGTMVTATASTNIIGGTFPAMIASVAANNGCVGITAVTDTLTLNISIAKVSNSALGANGVSHTSLSACRLYVPLYQMNPDFAAQLLSLGNKRKVTYTDILQYKITNVSSTFNSLVTNGVTNPKRVIIVPFWSTSNTNAYSPLLSPFDPSPGTTTPLVALTQLNLQLSGQNVWSLNELYSYEQFIHELSDSGINGGRTIGLGSGLLDQLDFETSYRYYVCNVGRRLPNDNKTPKSVQIMGTVAAAVALDLYVFIEYERECTVDIFTGEIDL